METTAAVLVDAFATEPTGGLPVAVLPDGAGLTDGQLRTVATEFAASLAVPADDFDRLRVVGPEGTEDQETAALVASLALAREEAIVDPGEYTIGTPAGTREVAVEESGRVWVDLATRAKELGDDLDADEEQISGALGVDVAALRDVGGDLPPTRLEGDIDTLAVGVNFLEHLGSLSPDTAALTTLAEVVDVDAICAFTFDTLAAESTIHARTFMPGAAGHPRATGVEVPVTPQIVGTCVDHLVGRGTVENDSPTVEQGHFLDRPALVDVRLPAGQVGGRGVPSVTGTATHPPAQEDDIIEV